MLPFPRRSPLSGAVPGRSLSLSAGFLLCGMRLLTPALWSGRVNVTSGACEELCPLQSKADWNAGKTSSLSTKRGCIG